MTEQSKSSSWKYFIVLFIRPMNGAAPRAVLHSRELGSTPNVPPIFAAVVLWESNGLSIRFRRVRFSSAAPVLGYVQHSHLWHVGSIPTFAAWQIRSMVEQWLHKPSQKSSLFFLFRRIRARCMDLTVNQWLAGFDPQMRSHIEAHYPSALWHKGQSKVNNSVFQYGGSSGLRRCLASIVSRRVRFPRPPPNNTPLDFWVGPRPFKPKRRVRFPYGVPIYRCSSMDRTTLS